MRRTLRFALSAMAMLAFLASSAQTRYLDEVFTSSQISIFPEINYGENYSVLTGTPDTVDLAMSLYMPKLSDDTLTDRPLIIFVHTGNFLPIVINGSTTGTRNDSSAANLCKSWAKRGFVAASIDYRLGWNPLDSTAEGRRSLLLQAVYRAVLDAKTAVRYFKKDAANLDLYRIDPNKIVVYGEGSGGYVSLAYATLDRPEELELPKFTYAATGNSYVDTMLWGNIDGFGGMFNIDNHSGYSNDVSMVVNAGGALADTSWLEGNEVPMVSFHSIRDGYAPFEQGIVIVPTTNENVVEVQGANVWMKRANDLGVNNAFANLSFVGDPYTARARSMYGQSYTNWDVLNPSVTVAQNAEGLFPIQLPLQPAQLLNGGAPWQWWDLTTFTFVVAAVNAQLGTTYDANTIHMQNLATYPGGMSATKGKTYLDTIQGYLIPRIMVSLQLPGYQTFSIDENEQLENSTQLYPNPATDHVIVEVSGVKARIEAVKVYNVLGQNIFQENDLDRNRLRINTLEFDSGIYVAEIFTTDGRKVSRRFMVK
jgi:hypothetical protein